MTPEAPPAGTAVCPMESLPDGGGRVFFFGPEAAPFGLLVLRSGDDVRGWLNRCPHFGQPLARDDATLIVKPHHSFSCNVHYARFRWTDGVCEFGDCEGEALTPVALAVVDGVVRFATDAV